MAILDDGSERTIILHSAAQKLQLNGQSENLAPRAVNQDIKTVSGQSVSFFHILHNLSWKTASYPQSLQCCRARPLQTLTQLKPYKRLTVTSGVSHSTASAKPSHCFSLVQITLTFSPQ
ncbi:hypothetical protein AMECASPLE_018837 [Ameca splendens]|uniref:Peptidase A2 domain-containing protein n=1 Tax=Ameca splendens TaxID=208324 RepID=A0ABV0YPX3_9TELE